MTDHQPAVVIDNGSSSIKIGFGGEEGPRNTISSVVGRPKVSRRKKAGSIPQNDLYIGFDAIAKERECILNHPIKRGIVTNWDNMEKIWHSIFYNELNVSPKERAVVITGISKYSIDETAQIMFETFNVPSLCIPNQSSSLACYYSGRETCISVDIGDGISQITPMINAQRQFESRKLNFGGSDLTKYLQEMLLEKNIDFSAGEHDQLILCDIKQRGCYVAQNFDRELKKERSTTKPYALPDGNTIKLSNEAFLCPELLFKPYLNGFESVGIHQEIFETIMKCDKSNHNVLFANIILSGGSSQFKGLPERIEKEISKLAPSSIKVETLVDGCPQYASWIGGSIISCIENFPKLSLTRQKYNNEGASFFHKIKF